jgi:heme-degrading monooxygenase HmoA
MIARTWAGVTRAADADAYLDYLHATGLAEFRATPGNRGALALRRIEGDRAEFLLLSLWDSEDAIRRFAGDDIGRAVFYPEDERFLVARDQHVNHYEVAFRAEAPTA